MSAMPGSDVDPLAGLADRVPARLAAEISSMPLIDHHVHGYFTAPVTRPQFEQAMNEGSHDAVPAFMTQFDSQLGFAIRRWCAPVLGLPAHASGDEYWAARSAMTPAELNGAFLGRAGVSRWIVDTGFSSDAISAPSTIAQESGGSSSRILRLEQLAENIADRGKPASSFPDDFREALRDSAGRVAGFKTIAAYRTGFDIDWSLPTDQDVAKALDAWRSRSSGPLRLDDPVIVSFIIHAAAELLLPIQVHVGFGDRDLDLHRTNPMLLLDLLGQASMAQTPLMLLHCYPFQREAGFLAQAFTNVYFDVGLTLNYVGTQSRQIVAESLELAPFAKQLYSSDAFGLPELHLLGSILWRRSMAQVLGGWVQDGDWAETDAIRIAQIIAHGNAARVYGPDL